MSPLTSDMVQNGEKKKRKMTNKNKLIKVIPVPQKIHLRNDIYSVFGENSNLLKGVGKFSSQQLNVPCGWWVNDVKLSKYLNIK